MPRGFGPEGQKLWSAVLDEFNLSDEPHKLRILVDACKTADWIHKMEIAAVKQPLTVRGSMGQPVINPLISQVQTERERLSRFLARLNFTEMED